MRITPAWTISTLLLLTGGSTAYGQQLADGSAPVATHALVQAALNRLNAAETEHARFTDFQLHHVINFNASGYKVYDNTQLYEETWINNLPYHRLVENNGKPLTGAALQTEQNRYNDAIVNRQPLGNSQRILDDGLKLASIGTNILDVLKPEYNLIEVNRIKSPHGDLRVIVAVLVNPVTSASACPWRYTMWISESSPTLFRYRADVPVNGSESCRDAFDDRSFDIVYGYPELIHRHDSIFVLTSAGFNQIEDDRVYTKYRRFTATVTMRPGAEVDDGNSENPK